MTTKDTDHVTKGEFREFRDEMMDFKGEIQNFKEAVFEMYDQKSEEYQRYVGALMEDNRSQTKMLVESMQMQIERFDRKFLLNDSEHKLFDRRLSVIESGR